MPNQFDGKDEKVHELSRYEHFRRGNVAAKKVVLYDYDASTDTLNPFTGYKLVPYNYDYIDISPSTARPTTVTYKTGGSGGITVATLTIAYDGSTNNITSVTRS